MTMNFQNAVKICLTKFVDIKGRASRSEYWWFVLFAIIVNFIAYLINDNFQIIVSVILLVPLISVTVRRLHDSDTSGWWWFITFIPLIGGLIILYFMIIEGTKGPNDYGEQPL